MTHVLIGVPARAEDKALWEAVPGCEFVYDGRKTLPGPM